jgi:predicted PolB exonuclease-like 3'-5' exonuclease
MFHDGKLQEIAAYCETDVLNLYGVFLRWAYLTGRIDIQNLEQSLAGITSFLAEHESARPHLGRFLHASPALRPAPEPSLEPGYEPEGG